MICANAKALGKLEPDKPPIYCLLACCVPVVGIYLLRQTARETYGIEVINEEDVVSYFDTFFMLHIYDTQNVIKMFPNFREMRPTTFFVHVVVLYA